MQLPLMILEHMPLQMKNKRIREERCADDMKKQMLRPVLGRRLVVVVLAVHEENDDVN